jgi:hypothetical protein
MSMFVAVATAEPGRRRLACGNKLGISQSTIHHRYRGSGKIDTVEVISTTIHPKQADCTTLLEVG